MDEIDRIQDLEDSKVAMRLSAIQAELALAPTSPDCEDCGYEIPQERRAAKPSATRCLECQSKFEKNFRYR